MTDSPTVASPSFFRCPGCAEPVTFSEVSAACRRCGATLDRLAPNLFQVRGGGPPHLTPLTWSSEVVTTINEYFLQRPLPLPVPETIRDQLVAHQLADANGNLTDLGENARYHVLERHWQTGRPPLDGHFPLDAIQPLRRVLDVGCGAGQSLRLLGTDPAVELVGLDTDVASLAMGVRFAQAEGVPITFVGASAHALPFQDGAFDLVTTRVALNYMHQRTALAEMVRVLRLGGVLFCRLEGFWHDVFGLSAARSPKKVLCLLRDMTYGIMHTFIGVQPTPGGSLRGGRAFASPGRIGRILAKLGCDVLETTPSKFGPTIFGRRTQFVVVARKRA